MRKMQDRDETTPADWEVWYGDNPSKAAKVLVGRTYEEAKQQAVESMPSWTDTYRVERI